jgi:hypothetical protein
MEHPVIPSGFSSFLKIRQENLLYIDKTEYINNLLSTKGFKNWFLARPRRFSKTLFINTLEQVFRSNEQRGTFSWPLYSL